ncbi:MAG: CheR family methyltransferase [Salinarimonas sp.]
MASTSDGRRTDDARRPRFPIVGVGASAGGVEALEGFFKGLPDTPGVGIVIVTHLNPERESHLHEIVRRYTAMEVRLAVDGASIEPNTVHVLAAGDLVGVEDGRLQVVRQDPSNHERKPIDVFFSALAKDQGDYAVGIVLSGGDGDGTLGVKAIKERGGLTLAQTADGSGPSHPDMPATAISTGLVDLALPAEKMGPRLVAFAQDVARIESMAGDEESADDEPHARPLPHHEPIEAARQEICTILRNQVGHDFNGYKTKTFLRRVHRRMQVAGLTEIGAYVERLRATPEEVTALFRDLLINVTAFFRDTESFQALEHDVIPAIFEGRGADDTVRVWIPGCATGEEVYSIAILMREHTERLAAVPRVQIFATDIDEHALSVARAARYPATLIENVDPARRDRWFTADGGTRVLAKEVRDMCIFSPHSVIRDPPFSRIDLVSCRNLLIYFGPQIQEQVLPIFHYALRPNGYLFLGLSENIGHYGDLFAPVNKKLRIFRAREDATTAVHLPALVGRFHPQEAGVRGPERRTGGAALRQAVEQLVLTRFAPPHVVVDAAGDVVYASSRTGRFLELSPGLMNRQLMAMARKGLRVELQAALRQAVEKRGGVRREDVAVEADDGKVQRLTIVVEPMMVREDPLLLVMFEAAGEAVPREAGRIADATRGDAAVGHLERELRETRERLQGMVEEYETAVEELKSSNEELVSVNEEMQSTNEELEASKEELQSLNEELHTVNSELSGKVEELDHANNDLRNLFDSTQVATVFLDRGLTIRSFTPAITQIFNILPSDAGRPLTDLSSRLDLPDLVDRVRTVFAQGEPQELNARRKDDAANFLVRLAPYRDGDMRTEGVVVTFIDVTQLTRAQQHQRLLMDELNHRVKNTLASVQAIAGQSFRGKTDSATEREAFAARLRALAGAHDVLTSECWEGADLAEIVRVAVDPFDPAGADARLHVEGPHVRLDPRGAVAIALALHELATNAVKHGALSVQAGRIAVTWEIGGEDGTRRLRLRWQERGGPPVSPPGGRGFGSRLIEHGLAAELQGSASLRFEPDGLVCEVDAPLADQRAAEGDSA